VSNLINLTKDYRQRLLNVRVMLTLRRALFERLLHLAASEAVGHEDGRHPVAPHGRRRHDDGLLQMAIVSPSISDHPARHRRSAC
jgi:ATP-binding cassette subfamily B protein/subfamily B ATP-binding cassette protein MsbA